MAKVPFGGVQQFRSRTEILVCAQLVGQFDGSYVKATAANGWQSRASAAWAIWVVSEDGASGSEQWHLAMHGSWQLQASSAIDAELAAALSLTKVFTAISQNRVRQFLSSEGALEIVRRSFS